MAAQAVTASAATLYVWQNSPSPAPPYATWASAATNIQDAINAAAPGDEVVVTNGVYATGGRVVNGATNRVAIDKPVRVRSINGPAVTVIAGAPSPEPSYFGLGLGSVRCAYLGEGAQLSGFTLTNGYARIGFWGGGAFCEPSAVLTNCMVINNRAGDPENDPVGGGVYGGTLYNCSLIGNVCHGEGGGAGASTLFNCVISGNEAFAAGGGGVSGGTLYNCLVTGNRAPGFGGGAFAATMYQCTVVSNSLNVIEGLEGAGVYGVTLYNCIVYHNGPQPNYSLATLNYSCTTPLPTNGLGNITNEPAFVNPAAGDYRLRAGSPCIDTGTNLSASITNDLDGRPRPLDGNGDGLAAFDMGAYEYKLPLHVWPGSSSPTPPYRTWATAAHTIQDAVDAAEAGDEIVVTNGLYATGGRVALHGVITNRVAVTKPVTVRSVNGPVVTVIQGYQVPGTTNGDTAIRCAVLTNGAALIGFTLTNGATGIGSDSELHHSGGGVYGWDYGAMVSNCVLAGNSAWSGGGGAYGGTLDYCTLTGNWAGGGGGAEGANLNNCQVTGNSAGYGGGGAVYGTLNNCVLKGNSAGREGGGTGAS